MNGAAAAFVGQRLFMAFVFVESEFDAAEDAAWTWAARFSFS